MEEVTQLTIDSLTKVNNVQISDVVVDRVGFNDVESAVVTLKQFMQLMCHTFHREHQTLQKKVGSWHAQEFIKLLVSPHYT
jgi:hypothetical protein